jgi:hypothetical protein
MAWERYRRRALDLRADIAALRYSRTHARWYAQAQSTGRWAPIGIRRDPWTVPEPRRSP